MPATPAWPPKSAPRLFVADELKEGAHLSIDGAQGHYLSKVMRVRKRDTVILCDDKTGEWAAQVDETGKRWVELTVFEQLRPREDVPDLWLCPALLKKDRFDFVLEKATELGVAAIHPVVTRRCVADKLNPERARTIVTEAAEQCARTALPEVSEPAKLEALLKDWPEGRTLYYASERGGLATADIFIGNYKKPAAILIGPEGGFDDAEHDLIQQHPESVPISLGPRILRGETAAIAAIAAWMSEAGDWWDARDDD